MATKAKASKTRPDQRNNAEKDKGVEAEDRLKKVLAKMSPAERKEQLALCKKWTRDMSLTAAAAESDLLRWLLAISVEFAKRYYPTATSSGFYISEDHDDGKRMRNVYSAHISIPLTPGSAPVASPPASIDPPASNLLLWWASAITTLNELVEGAKAICAEMKEPGSPLAEAIDRELLEEVAGKLATVSCKLFDAAPRISRLPDPLA